MVNGRQLGYLLMLLDLKGWWPRMSEGAIGLLGACGSKLEQMCLLGFIHAMDQQRHRAGLPPQIVISFGSGMWSMREPWDAFPDRCGPGRLWIEPQAKRGERTVDFLFWIDAEPALVVEIDGYAHHRKRRAADRYRDMSDSLPTVRVLEETDPPLEWGYRLLDADQSAPCTHCGVPIIGGHSCPPW